MTSSRNFYLHAIQQHDSETINYFLDNSTMDYDIMMFKSDLDKIRNFQEMLRYSGFNIPFKYGTYTDGNFFLEEKYVDRMNQFYKNYVKIKGPCMVSYESSRDELMYSAAKKKLLQNFIDYNADEMLREESLNFFLQAKNEYHYIRIATGKKNPIYYIRLEGNEKELAIFKRDLEDYCKNVIVDLEHTFMAEDVSETEICCCEKLLYTAAIHKMLHENWMMFLCKIFNENKLTQFFNGEITEKSF